MAGCNLSPVQVSDETLQDRAVWPRSYEDRSYRNGFLTAVGDIQKAGVLQDVVLEVEGRRFPCHRLVLSAASPYFRAMFSSNMAESRQKTVVLQGLDPDMFEEVLSYIYSGTLHVSLDKVQPLYQAADLLQVDYVRETCTSYMAMNVERSTCLDLYKFADAFSVEKVLKCCLQYTCRYFEKVSTTAEFCSLSVDQLTDIISHDWLDVKKETTVWEAVVRWVEHCREDRQHLLPSILPHIRFNLMTSEETAAILEHPLVRADPGSCSQVIRNTGMVQRGTSKLKMRAGMDTQEMALLFSIRTQEMQCMNPRTGKYIRSPVIKDLDAEDVRAMTVTSNNDIYILTRLSFPDDGQRSLLVYNHMGNVWEHQSSVYRVDGGDDFPEQVLEYLVEVDGLLYHLAVIHLGEVHTFVWMKRYDQHTDQWAKCSEPQLNGRAEVGKAVSCGPHLYFITETEMHRYHPSNDQWSRMTTPVSCPYIYTAVATATEIFCQSNEVENMFVYDTVSDRWQKLPDWTLSEEEPYNNFNIDYCMLFVLEGRLHMFTGYSDVHSDIGRVDYAQQVCVLDRSKGVWRELRVTLPNDHWMEQLGVISVARMYLPCLNANGTEVQITARP